MNAGDSVNAMMGNWTHGVGSVGLAYLLVAASSLVGLIRGNATVRNYALWPVTSLIAMIVLFVVGLVLSLVIPDALARSMFFFALILMVGGFCGGLYWAHRGKGLARVEVRGAKVESHTQSRPSWNPFVQVPVKAVDPRALRAAGIEVPFEDETKHFKLIGTTGTGKSTVIRQLLHGALARGDRAVIADPDGGYLSSFYNPKRGDVILNPFDARSAKWDLFAELRNPYDIDELAQAFIPDRGPDPTWTNFARTLFSAITSQAQAAEIDDLDELYRLLVSAPIEDVRDVVSGTVAAPFLAAGNEKLFQGARSTLAAAIKSLDFVRRQTAESFCVREWIKTGKGVLFLPYQADQISSLKAIISIWMRLAIFQTLSLGEGDHRLWFAVDELDALGAINGLPDALTRLRKVGGRCVLGLQSIAQASTHFGHGPAQSIIENCGNTLALRCSASEGGGTAQYVSRLIGEREVVRLVKSESRSGAIFGNPRDSEGRSEQMATELAVMAAEIEQLADRSGFLKFTSQPNWRKVTFPVYPLPKVAEAFVPISSGARGAVSGFSGTAPAEQAV